MFLLRIRRPWPAVVLTSILAVSQVYFGGRLTQGVNDFIAPSSASDTKHTPQFDCSQLINSTVVREIGTGKQKSTFEIILPNGVHAAAKRCHSSRCINERRLLYEDYFFRNLFLQYGKDAIGYYGMCSYPQNWETRYSYETMSDFTRGDTLFLELAKPVMANWTMETEPNQLQPDAQEDLESLRIIARQYDDFVGGRILLGKDNQFAHQYVRAEAGIRHADFDMVKILLPDSPSILDENCALLMNKFAKLKWGDSRFYCTEKVTQWRLLRLFSTSTYRYNGSFISSDGI